MASVAEELNPPDLLSSVSAMNASPDSEDNQEKDDQSSEMNARDADLLLKIMNLHCPFIWKPEDSLNSYNSDSVEDIMNVDEVFDEASGFKLRKFVIHLILCYNNFNKRLIDKSLKNLDEMEKMLLTSMKNRSQDVYFTLINDALYHILHSCRVVMLHSTNQVEKALQALQKVTPYDALNPTNQAGIWAVRAHLYVEFGYEGIKAAIQYIEKATKIDNDNPQWHFLKGMYLGRLRRMESVVAIPSMDEIAALELAMKLKEDASFMAFAAEVYVETASRTKKKSQMLLLANEEERRKLAEKNDMINDRAALLFKKSVSLNKNNAHLLFRCGKGMLKLVPPYQDVRLARKYIERGLEIAYDSSFGNHAMALYYMKHEEDYDKAKKYLIKATESKNFGAEIDLIRVNFLIEKDAEELIDGLLKLFDRYDDKMKHRKILAEIEAYYLFIEYDLMKAIHYMNKLLYLIVDHDDIISTFKSGVLRQRFPVSLLEILLSDIADRSNKEKLNSEEQDECRKFMQRLCYQNVTIPRPKKENLRKTFVKDIRSNFKDMNVRKVESSSSRTAEKPVREDYNPVECRFDKQYAKKYYEEDESSKPQKNVVDEFFEKYQAKLELQSQKEERTESRKGRSDKSSNQLEAKSKESSECHPILQRLFNKMNEPSKEEYSSDESEDDDNEDMIDKISRQLNLRLSVSARSEISKKMNRSKNINDGASTSRQKDHFKASLDYRRRSSRSPAKRSRSRESRRTGKELSNRRSDSRESYRSTNESHRRRSPSTESRYSTRHSHRRRSPSRESRRRSRSRDERRSHKNRSLSRESYYSTKERRALRDRSKSREDNKSSRRRLRSREDKYAGKSNRRRSSSRESESTSGSERRSRKEQSSSKGRRKRAESRESIDSRKESIRTRRSLSRENYSSSKPASKRRSTSRDSHPERSISKESHRSSKVKERSPNKDSRRSSRESRHKRSASKESHKSRKESTGRRSSSRESRRSPNVKNSRNERSISKESHRSSKVEELPHTKRSLSKESCRSSKQPHQERSTSRDSRKVMKSSSSKTPRDRHSPVDYSDSKTISADSDESANSKERSRSRNKRRSPVRSPLPERKKRSEKYKKYESDETLTESTTDSDTDHGKYKSSKKNHRRDRHRSRSPDHRRRNRHRSYSSDETRSIRSSDKESSQSESFTSRNRRDNRRRKHFDSPYEDGSSDSSSRSHRKLDKKSGKEETDDKVVPQQRDDDHKNDE
ncbi:trichohyalin-like [Planococcus citri]|uniref:trichohyalin-like n=1 Tax=Planococcus citri TaxID=170843 RepID=UPI0031F957CF